MTKEEILAGLKQAIERGESLEQAKQSFINAGYNPRDVEEAAASFEGVLTEYPKPAFHHQTPLSRQQPAKQTDYQINQSSQSKNQKNPRKIVLILLIILIIFLVSLFAILGFFLREKIISFIENLF